MKLKMIENRLETEMLALSMLAKRYLNESKKAEAIFEALKPLIKKVNK